MGVSMDSATNMGMDYDISGAPVPKEGVDRENPAKGGKFYSDCDYSTTAKGGENPGGGGSHGDWTSARPSKFDYL